MDYKGYEVTEGADSITVENVNDFDPVHTFECGQCFRWYREADSSYTGIVKGRAANISLSEEKLLIRGAGFGDFTEVWFDYLDLGRDYSAIKEKLSADANVKKAIAFGGGIRLLRQDLWEALVSFIISTNNSIPRIMKIVAAISEAYGDKILHDGRTFYTFPDAERLANTSLEQLMICRGGFRCRYIHAAARLVVEGSIDLNVLGGLGTSEAREMLKRFMGVGDKVADCTLLYSGLKYDVFPTDVWVKRVMEELYFERDASFKEIWKFSSENFAELAGFAQQYLFYYAREHRIGA
jgi:N-glycosylase/DNA lyase